MCPNDSPTEPNSALPVQQRYLLDLDGQTLETTNVKCSTCKTATPTQWVLIEVASLEGKPKVEIAQLFKRLTLCQNCGTLRLTK